MTDQAPDPLDAVLLACPGYEHDGASYNAILEPACAHCRYSWWAHKREGRPHPPKSPPLKEEAPVPLGAPLSPEEAAECARVAGLDLDELERLAGTATPGPWATWPDGTEEAVESVSVGHFVCHLSSNMRQFREDAAFIARAREAVPQLIAALCAATAERDALHAAALDAADCLRRALQAGVPYSLPPRSEVRLALELLQAALAARTNSAQSERIDT